MNRDKFRRTANLEETPSKAMLAIDGASKSVMGLGPPKETISLFLVQGHPQREDHAMLVSGCLKAHGQGTTVYLSDFKNFESRICYLWEEPKEEHTGKGTLKLGQTYGILMNFITEIENLVDKKVKIIRCDNGTEFKNRVMKDNLIIARDGPKWLFDIDNASNDEPQPSSDVKKKDDEGDNATLKAIHADFFGREIEVDMRNITIAYPVPSTPNTRIHKDHSLDHVIGDVQSSVLTRRMTKTTNEQGFISAVYEGKTHEDLHTCLFACFISQEEPKKMCIGCIKFDMDWVLVVFQAVTKSMNYVPVVAGTNSNDFVGTKESIGVGHSSEETGSSQDYILMPLWKYGSPFNSSSKDVSNDEPQPSNDAGKKDDEGGIDDQEMTKNSAQDVNTAGPSINTASTNFNTGSLNINTVSLIVPTAPVKSTYANLFGDESELDLSNIATTYPVPTTLNTRIHKDHSPDHVLGDV
ncbi:hypothetical protein Tco_1556702 [Tanacetum coccineum]